MPRKTPTSLSHQEQAKNSADRRPVRCAVLTVSDTRTLETDQGGPLIQKHLAAAGHRCVHRELVRDDPQAIAAQIEKWLGDAGIDAILITGGTGISRRDTTVEVARQFLSAELEGFGELFRMLSYQEVGPAAMLSRAIAGLAAGKAGASATGTFIFAMPGSPNAVETAMSQLIAPQLAHLVWERRR